MYVYYYLVSLWDLKHYCDLAPNGKDWEYRDTIVLSQFEEMIKELLDVEVPYVI
jgi:hypothetical protein